MTDVTEVNQWVTDYGARLGTPLKLENGLCALRDGNEQEAAVIEVPAGNEVLLLHCHLLPLSLAAGARFLRTLLALNFETDAMRGCWLALDEEEAVRLCSQHALVGMTSGGFAATLEGFIQQVAQVRDFIASLPSEAA